MRNSTEKHNLPETRLAKRLLNVWELADLLNCSPKAIRRWADSGRIPRPIKLGSLVRFDKESIEKWIDAGCPKCTRS